MKKILNISFLALLVSLILTTSCIGDLNTQPLNETDATSETAYKDEVSYLKSLGYIYGY